MNTTGKAGRRGQWAAGLAAIVLAEQHFLPPRTDDRMPLRFEPYPFWLATGAGW